MFKHFSIFFPRVHQTQKLYQFINPGSSLLLPKRKYETNSATYISAYNICMYIYIYIPGGRSNIKPGIVTDSRRQQCMIFIQNLWRYKKACWWNLYIQLLLPFLCLNFNLSLELTSRIIGWSVNWQSDSTYFEQSCSNWIDFQHQRWFSSYKILFTLLNSRMVQLLEDKKSES